MSLHQLVTKVKAMKEKITSRKFLIPSRGQIRSVIGETQLAALLSYINSTPYQYLVLLLRS
jgi:hypothetical protein